MRSDWRSFQTKTARTGRGKLLTATAGTETASRASPAPRWVFREIAVASPYTHLGHQVEVELDERGPSRRLMSLMIRAYVYDHRHESRMQTDLLRRAKHEFYSLGLLKAQEGSNEDSGRGVSE